MITATSMLALAPSAISNLRQEQFKIGHYVLLREYEVLIDRRV